MALSAEQGMIRNITNRVIPDGICAFDAELGTSKPQVRSSTKLKVYQLSTRLGVLHFGSCEGGALPVIMSITGPRETHDYLRNI